MPSKVTLASGESKYACSCGQSKTWPWCDGSHRAYNEAHGTKYIPIKVANEGAEEKDFWICTCGKAKTRPFCDGSHASHAAPSE